MSRKVLIFGVSGLIGSSLAPLLTKEYEEVVAPVRKPHGNNDPQLQTPIIDFSQLSTNASLFYGSEVLFYCLGTTRKRAGSFAKFRETEWSLANQVLGSARQFGVPKVVLISAQGANERSLFGYMKVKGDIERYAQSLGFDRLVIARPSLLMGERSEMRALEGLSISLLKPVLRPIQRYFPKSAPIQDFELSQALVKCAQMTRKSVWIVENQELLSISGASKPLQIGPLSI